MNQIKRINFAFLFEISISIFIGIFVVSPKLSNLAIPLIVLSIIYGYVRKDVEFKLDVLQVLLIAFYLIYLIGIFWTNHLDIALQTAEKKLALLVFPLILSFRSKSSKFNIRVPIISFALSILLVSIWGFFYAYFNIYSVTTSVLNLTSTNISSIHHPSYFSMFHFFSMNLVYYGYQQRMKGFTKLNVTAYILFSIIFQVFLMSLAGLLLLFLFFGFLFFKYLYKKLNRLNFYLLTAVGLVMIYFSFSFLPSLLKEEINQSKLEFSTFIKSPKDYVKTRTYPLSGNATRLTMWTASCNQILKHPFGVGTGNMDDYLSQELIALGQPELAQHLYNPHNQYLQIFLEVGVFGFLLFITILFYGCLKANREWNWLLLVLLILLIFNALFESILQRHSGIVFFTFWICLLTKLPLIKKV